MHSSGCMAAKKKKTSGKRRGGPRASWRGNLSFGLVTFPVQAFNARSREGGDIHFHQLHAGCHRRIRYKKVCPVHGELSQDEIVSGYEYRKGQYIEIDPEELDALRTEAERSLTIDAFIEPDAVDPVYFDGRMYYLAPDGHAADESYTVIAAAMEREERVAIGQVVFSGKQQLALVRPVAGTLHMAMLNYDEEIRPPEEVLSAQKRPHVSSKNVQLAQTLVRTWSSDDFDFAAYDDQYRIKVKNLIDDKVAGREIVLPEEPEAPQVVNLMDALKRSISRERHGKGDRSKPRKRRRSA
jgi:DNA end-binding protein Ku